MTTTQNQILEYLNDMARQQCRIEKMLKEIVGASKEANKEVRMKKVYCKDCRWYQGNNVGESYFPAIGKVKGCDITIDCVKPKTSGYANSRLLNKENDCDWYNKKHWWNRGK